MMTDKNEWHGTSLLDFNDKNELEFRKVALMAFYHVNAIKKPSLMKAHFSCSAS